MLCFTLPSGSGPQSLQVAVSPCCIQVLPSVISQIFPRIPGPLPRWLTRCSYPFLPLSHRPSPNSQRVGLTTTLRSTTSERGVLTRLQSFDNLQASEFAATQVVPTAGIPFGCQGSRGVYIRAVRGSLPPRASDMLAVRIGQLTAEVFHLLDLQPCWLLRTFTTYSLPVSPAHRREFITLLGGAAT